MKKLLLGIMIGIVCSGITVYAATQYLSSDIEFTPTDSNWNVSNVSDALNDLYAGNNINYDDVLSNPNILNSLPSIYSSYYIGSLKVTNGAYVSGSAIYLPASGSIQFGPYISMNAGCYQIIVNGTNLDNADLFFDSTSNDGQVKYNVLSLVTTENYASYYIYFPSNTTRTEFRAINYSISEVSTINSYHVFRKDTCPSAE